jgi:hypothetical protein
MSDLDRILSSDPVIEPSAGFAARVMGQVRQEATAPPPIEFPWRRFLPGAIACAAILLIALGLTVANFDPAATPVEPKIQLTPAFDIAVLGQPSAIAALALVGSLLVAWLATRFAALPSQELF